MPLIQPGVWVTEDGNHLIGGRPLLVERHTVCCPIATDYLRYLPMRGLNIDTSIDRYYCGRIMLAAGYLRSITCRSVASGGTIVWGIHKNGNVTPIETSTGSLPAATTTTFPFALTNHFAAGDRVHVSFDPGAASPPGDCTITLEWVFA